METLLWLIFWGCWWAVILAPFVWMATWPSEIRRREREENRAIRSPFDE